MENTLKKVKVCMWRDNSYSFYEDISILFSYSSSIIMVITQVHFRDANQKCTYLWTCITRSTTLRCRRRGRRWYKRRTWSKWSLYILHIVSWKPCLPRHWCSVHDVEAIWRCWIVIYISIHRVTWIYWINHCSIRRWARVRQTIKSKIIISTVIRKQNEYNSLE